MKKTMLTIDNSEKERILEMYYNTTKKQNLTEQTDVTTWPEKQVEFSGASEQEISIANISYLSDYYGVQIDGTTVNPDNLIGKTAYFFNYNNNPLTAYMLSNLNPNTFVINDILYNPKSDSLYLLGNTYPFKLGETVNPNIRIGGGAPTEVNLKDLQIQKKYKSNYLPTKISIKPFYFTSAEGTQTDNLVNSVFVNVKTNFTWAGSKYDKTVRDGKV